MDFPYCTIVENCSKFQEITPDTSVFLIEPWDELKKKRDDIISTVLHDWNPKYTLSTADRDQSQGLLCDICTKIQKSSFCIVDFSPKRKNDDLNQFLIRPNVAFEVGMAVGFRKPIIIITSESSDNFIPSDLQGIVYVSFNGNWEELKNNLKEKFPNLRKLANKQKSFLTNQKYKAELQISFLKSIFPYIKLMNMKKKMEIYGFKLERNEVICLFDPVDYLKDNLIFEFFSIDNSLERHIFDISVHMIQDTLIQGKIIKIYDKEYYYENISNKLEDRKIKRLLRAKPNVIKIPRQVEEVIQHLGEQY